MLRTVNRVLVGLAGALLVALGAAVLIGALDLQRRWGFSLPSGWPFTGPDDVPLTTADRTRWRAHDWWWPAVIGGLAGVVLLALWWLYAQVRPRRPAVVRVPSQEAEILVRGRALEEALAAEAAALTGIDHALVTLNGRSTAPEARIALTLTPRAAPATALRGLRDVLRTASTSTALPSLPAEIRLRAVRHRARRVD
ncbi:alkaline shock response membrane anchor protein AmaP [Streptomyces sp. NPDC049577]|uniref:alkaline shock response membrane anchor protein AmaP n=1 Tax=Streptomyces sp. NPDC049577 TaxID=3155153 RepID=UPI0034420607